MPNSEHSSKPTAIQQGSNHSGSLGRLRRDASATADELRRFLDQTRGRSPAEVLGLVAQSSLALALLQATVGCLVLVALLTVGPLAWSKLAGDPADAGGQTQGAAANPTPGNGDTNQPEPPRVAAGTGKEPGGADKLADKLGESGTKTGQPDPLESLLDKDLDK